jgi:hypothetical protein
MFGRTNGASLKFKRDHLGKGAWCYRALLPKVDVFQRDPDVG